jgi:tRNA nucleotidyltransferase (CCA-adding enzyme)
MIKYPTVLNPIFNKLELHNISCVIVGGYVRDCLLNIKSKDIDVEVYGVRSLVQLADILQEFGSVNSVGKSFGVCKLKIDTIELDFSLPREDNKIGTGHKGFEVITNSSLDYKDAAIRRDFTINSMGYDVKNKKILDPFHGLEDLKNKTLNAVNETTFIEDPLRVLRGVQFSARFNFTMSEKLFLLCKNMIENSLLDELSQERIYEEIKKLLLKSLMPSKGFKLLKELGALKYFPPLQRLSSSSFNTILTTLDCVKQANITYKLSALSYKFPKEEIILFITHLTSDKKLLKDILIITQNYKEIDTIYKKSVSDYEIYKLATKANIEELVLFNEAVCCAENINRDANKKVQAQAIKLGVLNKPKIAILEGEDILQFGIKPSKIYSQILDNAYEAQMHSEFNSHEGALSWLENNYSHLLS